MVGGVGGLLAAVSRPFYPFFSHTIYWGGGGNLIVLKAYKVDNVNYLAVELPHKKRSNPLKNKQINVCYHQVEKLIDLAPQKV